MIKGLKELEEKYAQTKTGKTLSQYGYGIPEKPKETTLSKVFNLLRTGEFAMGGILSGKGIKKGIKQKIQPSTVLGIKSKVGRLAVDILLDPTTYLTFGYGGGAKITAKTGGQVVLSKAGTKLLKQTTKKIGEKAARKSLAEVIARGGVKAEKKYIAKGGIKFMGKEIVPRKVAVAPFKGADIALTKTPVLGKKYVAGKELAEKMFKPFAAIEKLPAHLGGKGAYVKGIYKPFVRKTSDDIIRAVEPIIKAGKIAEKATAKPWYKLQFKKPKVGEEIAEAIEKGVSGNKVVDDIAKWMKSEHKIMINAEKGRGIAKTELPNYLRHFITDKGREFLDKGGNMYAALSKPLRVKLGAAKPRKLEGTIKEINKAMVDKVGGNFFEPDAFKAFAGRKVEHIKAINTYDFLQYSAARFSRPAEYITKTDGTKVLKKTVIDGVEFVESAAPQLKGVVLPKPIAQHIDETAQILKSDEAANVFLKTYDNLLRFWKGTVTGYFPAFHTRNFIGGVFNNWLAGLKNPMRYKQATKILNEGKRFAEEVGTIPKSKIPKSKIKPTTFTTKLGTKYTSVDILKMARENGVTGQTGMMDVMREVQKEIGQSKWRKLGNYPRFLMETVENKLRLPLFIDRLMKGDTPKEAAEWVFKFHFDYVPQTGMTAFERNWMKRLIPFYTWTRNNIPLQFEQMIKQPSKYSALEKTRQSISGKTGEKEFEYLPDWMREQFTMRVGKNEAGQSLWLQLDLPLEDVAKLPINESGVREIVSMLSPLLKFPIERYTNKELYFGGEIVDPLLADHPELQTAKTIEALKHLPEPIKKFLNFKRVQYRDYTAEAKSDSKKKIFKYRYEMDAKKLHLLRSAVGRFYMTVGQWFDPETATWIKAMRLLGGVPVRPFDIEEEKDWRKYEKEEKERKTLQYLKKHKVIPYEGAKPTGIVGLEELEAKYKLK